jgi:basic amino acid/polyamine antiporter, APA family
VNGGVLVMQRERKETDAKFKTPYINARLIMPLVTVFIFFCAWKFFPYTVDDMLKMRRVKPAEDAVKLLTPPELEAFKPALKQYFPDVAFQNVSTDSVKNLLTSMRLHQYEDAVHQAFIDSDAVYYSGADGLYHQFTNYLFVLLTLIVTFLAVWKKLSLIPLLGLVSCFYLMTQEGPTNWARFLIWLAVGLVIYFFYSYRHSKLHMSSNKD